MPHPHYGEVSLKQQDLVIEMALYEKHRKQFEQNHLWEWVVIHDNNIIGFYKEFQEAAQIAVERFGRGPYLIKEVGRTSPPLPASVLYRPFYADS